MIDVFRQSAVRWLMDAFATVYLVYLSGSTFLFFGWVESGRIAPAAQTQLYVLSWLLLNGVLLALVAAQATPLLHRLVTRPVLLLLIATAILSTIFNEFGAASIVRLALFLMTMVFGLWVALNYSDASLRTLLIRTTLIVLPLYFVSIPMVGETYNFDARGWLPNMGSYGGGFEHKNIAGHFFGLAIVTFASIETPWRQRPIATRLASVLCGIALILTGSATALVALLCALYAMWLLFLVRRGCALLAVVVVLATLSAIAVLALTGFDQLTALVGRDATLTNRALIWSHWPEFFSSRPIFGYGYGNFFENSDNSSARLLSSVAGINVTHFHNTVLEYGIAFGSAGILLFLALLLAAFKRSVQHAWTSHSDAALAPIGWLVFVSVTSTVEGLLMRQGAIAVSLLVYCYFLTDRKFLWPEEPIYQPGPRSEDVDHLSLRTPPRL